MDERQYVFRMASSYATLLYSLFRRFVYPHSRKFRRCGLVFLSFVRYGTGAKRGGLLRRTCLPRDAFVAFFKFLQFYNNRFFIHRRRKKKSQTPKLINFSPRLFFRGECFLFSINFCGEPRRFFYLSFNFLFSVVQRYFRIVRGRTTF